MNKVVRQLNKLIKINRLIINQLHKDEANIELLQQRLEKRGRHTNKLTQVIPEVDETILTEKEKIFLKKLFDRFAQQQSKVDKALDYILEESKERLSDAIKTNKAEQSYRVLNR